MSFSAGTSGLRVLQKLHSRSARRGTLLHARTRRMAIFFSHYRSSPCKRNHFYCGKYESGRLGHMVSQETPTFAMWKVHSMEKQIACQESGLEEKSSFYELIHGR